MDQIQKITVEILANVIIALVTFIAAYATVYLQKAIKKLKLETEKIKSDERRELLKSALERLEDVTKMTVNKIEQTTAKSIRDAVKDGKLDKEELQLLAYDAYGEIVEVLDPEYKKVLEDSLGDSETYILNLIEEKLEEIKNRSRAWNF